MGEAVGGALVESCYASRAAGEAAGVLVGGLSEALATDLQQFIGATIRALGAAGLCLGGRLASLWPLVWPPLTPKLKAYFYEHGPTSGLLGLPALLPSFLANTPLALPACPPAVDAGTWADLLANVLWEVKSPLVRRVLLSGLCFGSQHWEGPKWAQDRLQALGRAVQGVTWPYRFQEPVWWSPLALLGTLPFDERQRIAGLPYDPRLKVNRREAPVWWFPLGSPSGIPWEVPQLLLRVLLRGFASLDQSSWVPHPALPPGTWEERSRGPGPQQDPGRWRGGVRQPRGGAGAALAAWPTRRGEFPTSHAGAFTPKINRAGTGAGSGSGGRYGSPLTTTREGTLSPSTECTKCSLRATAMI